MLGAGRMSSGIQNGPNPQSGLYMMISASFTHTVGLQGAAPSDLYNSVIVAIPSKRNPENRIGASHHGQAGAAASVTAQTAGTF